MRSLPMHMPMLILCLFVLGPGLGPLAQAHEDVLPPACMERKVEPKIIHTFELTAEQLKMLQKAQGVHLHNGPEDDYDKCGIVDEWRLVDKVTGTYCRLISPTHEDAAAMITGPQDYLSPHHHVVYDLAEGVTGVCYVCMPP